jgi:hypothetical protein
MGLERAPSQLPRHLLADVADAFAGIEDPAKRVELAFELFDSEGVALGQPAKRWHRRA